MADKLGSFLRVLASGLSPQAFQANVQQFQSEQADVQLQEREQRAEDRGMMELELKNDFANMGLLATAAQRAKGDPKVSHNIGIKLKEITDKWQQKGKPGIAGMITESFGAHVLEQQRDMKGQPETVKLQEERSRLAGLEQTEDTQRRIQQIDNILTKKGTITGTTAFDPKGLEKKTKSKIQDTLIKTGDSLARLGELKRTFKKEYLTYGTQASEWLKAKGEKLGIKDLSPEERKKSGEYAKFKRKTFSFLNEYIHDMSGAAVSVQEAKRMVKALQTMQDSPTEYEAKLQDLIQEVEAKQARYEHWAKEGLISDKTTDRDLRSLETEFPQQAFAGLNKARDAISKSGDPEAARAKAMEKLKPWFERNGYDPRLLESL